MLVGGIEVTTVEIMATDVFTVLSAPFSYLSQTPFWFASRQHEPETVSRYGGLHLGPFCMQPAMKTISNARETSPVFPMQIT
jgi:hypothetical protein